MDPSLIRTQNLVLVPQSRENMLSKVVKMQPSDKKSLSKEWLALLEASAPVDPWIHGFELQHSSGGELGQCGFKGPPKGDGCVEIAYGISPEHQGKGYATEAAGALVRFAFRNSEVTSVLAHTLPEENASTRVLMKCGFTKKGDVIDPEDGLVWRWELLRTD